MRRGMILAIGLAAAAAANTPALAQAPQPSAKPAPAKPAPSKPAPDKATPGAPSAKPAAPPDHAQLSVKDIMRHIVNPAAESYWTHSGEVDDEKGANDRIPTSQEQWNISIDNAATIVEAANLLMTEGRARDPNGPWMKYAIALNKAGVAGMAAATAHDHDKTNDAGSAMYDACFACHGRYIPRPKDSLYKRNIDEDLKAAGKPTK